MENLFWNKNNGKCNEQDMSSRKIRKLSKEVSDKTNSKNQKYMSSK